MGTGGCQSESLVLVCTGIRESKTVPGAVTEDGEIGGKMLPTIGTDTPQQEVVAGEGELRCTTCGYAISVASHPDTCPMCQGTDWDAVPWRPFSRDHGLASATVPAAPDAVSKVA